MDNTDDLKYVYLHLQQITTMTFYKTLTRSFWCCINLHSSHSGWLFVNSLQLLKIFIEIITRKKHFNFIYNCLYCYNCTVNCLNER